MSRDEFHLAAVVAMSLIGGALLTYGMGAALHWSIDPGEWSMKVRGTLVFLIWPLSCGVIALVLPNDRRRW